MTGMSASSQMSFKCGDIKNGIVCVYYHPKMRYKMQDKKKRNIELLVLGQYMRKQILAFTLGTHGL